MSADREYVSQIALMDGATGQALPSTAMGIVLLSSAGAGWRGITVERHRRGPREMPESYIPAHGVSICTGTESIDFGWQEGGRWRDRTLNPTQFHLVTNGELNRPRWLGTLDEVSLVLDPCFVADLVRDGLPPDRVAFASQRFAYDPTIVHYAEAFCAELEAEFPKGPLYADTLTIGFTLHLLSTYGVARPQRLVPRGKLSARQLRTVVDFIHAHVRHEVPLTALAEMAHVSPFHFARQFRATVGVAPHQYVLRQRVQHAIALAKAGKLPLAQIAVESGFHDQAHLTKAFRKLVGTTPARYLPRR